jgi:outer membrane cobalamin receptor
MHRLSITCALCVSASSALAVSAHADGEKGGPPPAIDEVIRIEGRAPDEGARDRDRALGAAPFVTVVHPDEHAPTATVADALASSAGAQTRSLGGLGAFESTSVRGAAPGHTAVLVDGVPLARIAAVTADLGRFALGAFGEVDLYRGAVPLELGGAGVGGAINLVTRLGRGDHGERVTASAGAGSFGARHVRLHYGDDHGGYLSSTTVGYQGARGDYRYFSDGGTPLNPADDGAQVRANNGFDQLDAASRFGTERWAAGGRAIWKHQGLPGNVAQPALAASLVTLDAIADARATHEWGAATARELGYVLVERQTLRDPDGELGLGAQDRAYLTLSGGAASTWTAALTERAHASVGGELRGDWFRDDGAGRDALVGTRGGAALAAMVEIALARVTLTPALRLDAVRTAPTPETEGPDAFVPLPVRWDVVPSPRVTALAPLGTDTALKASAGYYVRLPTLLELFGDRGTILGAPELRAERGPSADAGAVWAPAKARGPVDRVLVEAAAFAHRARDTIALVTYAGFVARAENVGDTDGYGGELVGSARLYKTLTLSASYTRLVTAQRSADPDRAGNALPRTPGHLLYARADAAGGRLGGWVDVAAQSTAYLDAANLARVPARALLGCGARVVAARNVAIALAVENVGDLRTVELPADRAVDMPIKTALTDLAGYPLPGRSLYVSLDWSY